MHHRHQSRPLRKQFTEGLHIQYPGIIHRHHLEYRTRPLTSELPRHDVGVMLHVRDQDFVTRLQHRTRKAVRNQVDPLRSPTREKNFVRVRDPDKVGYLAARGLIGIGRLLAQVVHSPVDIRILRSIVALQGVDHRLRLLRRRSVVQIRQRLAPHLAGENREVGAYGLVIKCYALAHTAEDSPMRGNLN